MKYDKARDKVIVREINDQHCHVITPEQYASYRQNRRLNAEEVQRAKDLINSNIAPAMISETISQISGKAVTKKDVYNLQKRLKEDGDVKPSRRHFRDPPSRNAAAVFPGVYEQEPNEVTISSESMSEAEDTEQPKSRACKRKMAEDSAMQSLLESTLAEVAGEKSDLLSMPNLQGSMPNLVSGDTDPIQDFSEVEISSSTIAPPTASTSKRIRTVPVVRINPIGTKLNLLQMAKEGSTEVEVIDMGGIRVAKHPSPGVSPKVLRNIRPKNSAEGGKLASPRKNFEVVQSTDETAEFIKQLKEIGEQSQAEQAKSEEQATGAVVADKILTPEEFGSYVTMTLQNTDVAHRMRFQRSISKHIHEFSLMIFNEQEGHGDFLPV